MVQTTQQFFDDLVSEYDNVIKRLVSPYPKMLWAMFYYLPKDFKPKKILELGCGTGRLTKVLHEQWDNSSITVVDISAAMLEKTKQVVKHKDLQLIESSMEKLCLPKNNYDLVISSLAIHHLTNESKIKLIKNIFNWLNKDGFFILTDCVRAQSERLYAVNNEHWIQLAKEQGLSEEEMNEQIRHHKTHDYYPVLIDLVNWMKEAGFLNVDILWHYCIWVVLQAQKTNNK